MLLQAGSGAHQGSRAPLCLQAHGRPTSTIPASPARAALPPGSDSIGPDWSEPVSIRARHASGKKYGPTESQPHVSRAPSHCPHPWAPPDPHLLLGSRLATKICHRQMQLCREVPWNGFHAPVFSVSGSRDRGGESSALWSCSRRVGREQRWWAAGAAKLAARLPTVSAGQCDPHAALRPDQACLHPLCCDTTDPEVHWNCKASACCMALLCHIWVTVLSFLLHAV